MLSKEIKLPKMILFDYGQTLVNERKFDGIKGTAEVMKYAVKNRHNYTAEDVQEAANAINNELGRYDPARSHLLQVEVPNCMFSPYLYESMGIELSRTLIQKMYGILGIIMSVMSSEQGMPVSSLYGMWERRKLCMQKKKMY